MIDFRSDTVTHPTPAMRDAMLSAALGDDVYGDDPTTNELQELAAQAIGKEAALFVPSGTFGNQLCLFTHANRGDEVIADDSSHIIQHEAGAGSVIAGVQFRTFEAEDGIIDPWSIEKRIRTSDDIHEPKTALICLENARSDGVAASLESLSLVRCASLKYNVPVHMDGARIFNAAAYLGIDAKDFSPYFDSISFCLSKGLCAPIGSIVAGSKDFILKARRKRKIMGGGMRQTGVLAAAGIVALKDMTKRLGEDNKNALLLAEKLSEIPCIEILNKGKIHINMVFAKIKKEFDCGHFISEMKNLGIILNCSETGEIRLVTHYWIKRDDVLLAAQKIKEYFS
ncbi:MAG: low specificity L-threonine aldolase [Clostridiales bacterium]|jgi:threonine aldolase|nr:low specificity L-threonine aldolase [Clostridiales bacterium]